MSGHVELNIFAFWYICWHSIAKLQPQSDHGPQREGGGTLILFDTCVGSGHFFLFNFLNYIIFYGGGGGSEILIFLGV